MNIRQTSGNIPGAQSDSAVRNVFLDELISECPIMEHGEFYSHVGNADNVLKNASATGGTVRAINSDYPDNTTAPVYGATALKIFGDKIQTDLAYQRRGGDVNAEHLRQIRSFARSMGRDLTDRFFNDSLDATHWNGLKALVPSGQKIVFDDATNGGTVPLGNATADKKQQQKFLEAIANLFGMVLGGATVAYMDWLTLSRIVSIGRDWVQTTTVEDALGKPVQLTTVLGVPVRTTKYKKTGTTRVIPHNETEGSSTDCTSIYAVKWSEKADLTFATNVGPQVLTLGTVGIHLTTKVDMDADLVLLEDRSVARLSGIRIVST